MGPLEQVEHRAVLLVEEPSRDVHIEVGRDADQVLIERPVMD
ncbi:MAG: hypothetical protein OEW47_13505 [Thermoleophilia bacterium]|nr:hypothetical protein [Thermoleophilia bacterium]